MGEKFHKPEAGAAAASIDVRNTLIDLTNPASNKLWQKMCAQDSARDQIRHDLGWNVDEKQEKTVYLDCADNGNWSGSGNNNSCHTTAIKLNSILGDVQNAIRQGDIKTQVMQNIDTELSLSFYLASQTYDHTPMAKGNTGYWDTASWLYEKALVRKLSSTAGEITHGTLMETALQVCGNDTQLAILTLANFSKNMAAIERRQITKDEIEPCLQAEYDHKTIDAIFHRIQGFADNPADKYNKEGAIYHFYGAMLAASQWGSIASRLVADDNDRLKTNGPTFRTDPVKDAAGLTGASCAIPFYNTHWWCSAFDLMRSFLIFLKADLF